MSDIESTLEKKAQLNSKLPFVEKLLERNRKSHSGETSAQHAQKEIGGTFKQVEGLIPEKPSYFQTYVLFEDKGVQVFVSEVIIPGSTSPLVDKNRLQCAITLKEAGMEDTHFLLVQSTMTNIWDVKEARGNHPTLGEYVPSNGPQFEKTGMSSTLIQLIKTIDTAFQNHPSPEVAVNH